MTYEYAQSLDERVLAYVASHYNPEDVVCGFEPLPDDDLNTLMDELPGADGIDEDLGERIKTWAYEYAAHFEGPDVNVVSLDACEERGFALLEEACKQLAGCEFCDSIFGPVLLAFRGLNGLSRACAACAVRVPAEQPDIVTVEYDPSQQETT